MEQWCHTHRDKHTLNRGQKPARLHTGKCILKIIPLPLSLSYLPLFLAFCSLFLPLFLSLSVSLSVSISLSLSFSLFLSFSLSLSHCVSVCLTVCVSVSPTPITWKNSSYQKFPRCKFSLISFSPSGKLAKKFYSV